jgi:cyclin-like protein
MSLEEATPPSRVCRYSHSRYSGSKRTRDHVTVDDDKEEEVEITKCLKTKHVYDEEPSGEKKEKDQQEAQGRAVSGTPGTDAQCCPYTVISFDIKTMMPIMRRQNCTHHPNPLYMDNQKYINSSMRFILVDWMMEAAAEFCCSRETVLMAVMCVDRFLSANDHDKAGVQGAACACTIGPINLQLLGIACLQICGKLTETHPPRAYDYCLASDGAYDVEQVVAMEKQVLQVFKWTFAHPTAFTWLQTYLLLAKGHAKVHKPEESLESHAQECNSMAQLIDATALDMRFLSFYPFTIAAAIFALELHYKSSRLTAQEIFDFTGFNCEDLLPCISALYWIDQRLKRVDIRTNKGKIFEILVFPKQEMYLLQAHNPHTLAVLGQLTEDVYVAIIYDCDTTD